MAADTATTQDGGVSNFACGSSTGAGAVIDVTLGFMPRHVVVYNATDAIRWEKFAEMIASTTVKTVTAGTMTTDTTSAIVVRSAGDNGYRGFTLSAALAASGKALHWYAVG